MATHARPNAASPLTASLVTAMKQCTALGGDPAGMTHRGTLAFPACQVGSPGTLAGPASNSISLGTPVSPAPAPAQGNGYLQLCATVGCGKLAPTLTGGDIKIESEIRDVRCVPGGTVACAAPGSNGAQSTTDYLGAVRGSMTLRITDTNNGSPGYTTHATMMDIPFSADGSCAENPGGGELGLPVGATCTINTTVNVAVPNAVFDGKRTNIGVRDITIFDGGQDGSTTVTTDGPNRQFLEEGVFLP
jgi:hypothetical protein